MQSAVSVALGIKEHRDNTMLKEPAKAIIASLLCAVCAAAAGQQPVAWENAMALFRQERWADAAAAFGQVENEAPGKTDALLYRGKALSRLEQFNEAADALQAYLRVHPASSDALYADSYVLYRQGRPPESIKAFSSAAESQPPTAQDLITVALDYSQLDNTDDAGYSLERALVLAPDSFEARYQLGRIRYRQRRLEEAIAIFQGLLTRDSTKVSLFLNLGLSFETTGQYTLAGNAYQKAIALESSSKHRTELPYLYLGRMLIRSDRTDDAIVVIRQGLAVNPKCSRLHSDLGRVYVTLKRLEEARSELEEAVRLDPRNRVAHYFLGRLYASTDKKEKAEEQMEITRELSRAEGRGGRSGMGSPLDMPPD